jgi:hypothetical protein
MSKTNDTCNLSHNTLDDHRPLGDSELDAVSGGTIGSILSDVWARYRLGNHANVRQAMGPDGQS